MTSTVGSGIDSFRSVSPLETGSQSSASIQDGSVIAHTNAEPAVSLNLQWRIIHSVHAIVDDVSQRRIADSTSSLFGRPLPRTYDVLERRLPPGYGAELEVNINAAMDTRPQGPVWDDNNSPSWAGFQNSHGGFDPDAFCAYIGQIRDLPSDARAAQDPQLLAIATARSAFEAQPNLMPTVLDRVLLAIARAIVPGGNDLPLNPTRAGHSLDVGRAVNRSLDRLRDGGRRAGTNLLVTASLPVTLPVAAAGTLAFGRREMKPESELLDFAVSVMAKFERANNHLLSTATAAACSELETHAAGTRHGREFSRALKELRDFGLLPAVPPNP